jgi:uncharacterized protein (TIGR02996 family)
MDQAAFLEAIAARPDDDSPRLIFADWLEERGDPRGTFVRLQCTLERLPSDDPRRPALEDEADRLLAAHQDEWAALLQGVTHGWRFRRGLVEWVEADGEAFLQHAPAWFAAFPLRGACLRLPPALMPELAACPYLGRLESLAFRGYFLRDRQLRELLDSPQLNRLTALDLNGHGIETVGVRALAESALLPRLRTLDLGNNRAVGDQAVRTLATASGAAGLHTLNLARTNLTPRGVSDLFGSAVLKGLRDLNVGAERRQDLLRHLEPIVESAVFQNLTALGMSNYDFSDPTELRRVLGGSAGRGLVRLDLSDCGLGNAAAEVIAQSPRANGLRVLDLGRNPIGADGLQVLADAPGLASLSELRMGHDVVRDTGVKALAASPHLTRLVVLDLGHNEIGGPGVQALAASPNSAGLRELDLSANYVGLGSVEALASSPHLTRLQTLRLNANRLGDKAAAVLSASTHLSRRLRVELKSDEPNAEAHRPAVLLGYTRRA